MNVSFLLLAVFDAAARSRRDGRSVWAGAGMVQKRADFVRGFGRQNVLELAGLLLDFGFAVHGQTVGEQPLGQAGTANDVRGPLPPMIRQFYDQVAITG